MLVKKILTHINSITTCEKINTLCVISGGYRSRKHSIEKEKNTPGTHAQGIACDIKVNGGVERFRIVEEALKMGFNGIGIAKNFVHVDLRKTTPVLWCY